MTGTVVQGLAVVVIAVVTVVTVVTVLLRGVVALAQRGGGVSPPQPQLGLGGGGSDDDADPFFVHHADPFFVHHADPFFVHHAQRALAPLERALAAAQAAPRLLELEPMTVIF